MNDWPTLNILTTKSMGCRMNIEPRTPQSTVDRIANQMDCHIPNIRKNAKMINPSDLTTDAVVQKLLADGYKLIIRD